MRILLPGQAGKRAGYSRPGTDFTEITSTCAADSQAAGDALATDGECKIDVGGDLVIWTKHLPNLQVTPKTTSGGSGGTSGGGGEAVRHPPALLLAMIPSQAAPRFFLSGRPCRSQ